MTVTEFLADLVRRLESGDVEYALVGSIASMVYGEPRATLDIDAVVALAPSDVPRFLSLFPEPEFYVSPERALDAARRGSTFNVIHPGSGMKLDVFVASDPIEERQLKRRIRKLAIPGTLAWFSPPEELIVKKLEYHRDGGSHKHLRDIRSMLRISPDQIDISLVEELVHRFGLEEEWGRVGNA